METTSNANSQTVVGLGSTALLARMVSKFGEREIARLLAEIEEKESCYIGGIRKLMIAHENEIDGG
jgi:hypothetical protein